MDLLRPGGRLFVYVPWIWRYHAPKSLVFQDYQRLSRDGMAWLLRDFDEVTLYPIRGRFSALANMLKWWKPRVERRWGGRVNRWLDGRTGDWRPWVECFTPDLHYIEHLYGTLGGREAIRTWIHETMQTPPA